jgi:hypothetical protein
MFPTGDGQAFMLDQRFFHESLKGGFFIGMTFQKTIFNNHILLQIYIIKIEYTLTKFQWSLIEN